MRGGTSSTLAVVRVARGAPRPSDAAFREAIARDRQRLHLPTEGISPDLGIAGPYQIVVEDCDLDEYVVWER
jgi:hypothetical protein